MKRTLIVIAILFFLFVPSLAQAQAPTPLDVPTLGPVIICSAGDSGNFVKITSPENQTKYQNPIQLNFNTQQITLLGQSYYIGYSIDGGSVKSVTNSVSRSIDINGSTGGYYKAKAVGNLLLPTLSEGFHSITVYVGWQYGVTGNPQLDRFDVFAYASVEFIVGNLTPSYPLSTPTPTAEEISTLGPVQIKSAGEGDTGIQIISPQNQSNINYRTYPIKLLFCVREIVLPYSFGNIGYSLDGGPVYIVSKFLNETRIRGQGDDVTVWVEVALPRLFEGTHVITAYYGYQFSGINQRYEVYSYSTVNFLVSSKTPTPIPTAIPTTTPTVNPPQNSIQNPTILAIAIVAVIVIAIGSLLLYMRNRKTADL